MPEFCIRLRKIKTLPLIFYEVFVTDVNKLLFQQFHILLAYDVQTSKEISHINFYFF